MFAFLCILRPSMTQNAQKMIPEAVGDASWKGLALLSGRVLKTDEGDGVFGHHLGRHLDPFGRPGADLGHDFGVQVPSWRPSFRNFFDVGFIFIFPMFFPWIWD